MFRDKYLTRDLLPRRVPCPGKVCCLPRFRVPLSLSLSTYQPTLSSPVSPSALPPLRSLLTCFVLLQSPFLHCFPYISFSHILFFPYISSQYLPFSFLPTITPAHSPRLCFMPLFLSFPFLFTLFHHSLISSRPLLPLSYHPTASFPLVLSRSLAWLPR